MNLKGYLSLSLDVEKLRVSKSGKAETQLLFVDKEYTSVFVDTKELLDFLTVLTEKVKAVHIKQNPPTL